MSFGGFNRDVLCLLGLLVAWIRMPTPIDSSIRILNHEEMAIFEEIRMIRGQCLDKGSV